VHKQLQPLEAKVAEAGCLAEKKIEAHTCDVPILILQISHQVFEELVDHKCLVALA
jgi:hypothetical protein